MNSQKVLGRVIPDLIRDPETFENTGFRVKPGMTIETVFGLFTIPSTFNSRGFCHAHL